MKEQHFGYRVKRALNQGLSLDPAILERLRSAREAALERQRQEEPPRLLAWSAEFIGGGTQRSVVPALLLSALLLVLGLLAVSYWHRAQMIEETVEIDSAVLMGELPLDAYLDAGFGAWLRRSSE